MCDAQFYSKGKKANAERVDIDVCIECAFQIASKRCDLTEDAYCDTCYSCTHQKGVYRKATWTPLVDMCENDCKRAAQWKCDFDGKSYCKPCFTNTFYNDLSVTYTDLPLHTEGMKAWKKIETDRVNEIRKHEEMARKRAEWEQRRLDFAQTNIARTWRGAFLRGYGGRKVLELLKAEWALRKRDIYRRKKVVYKVKDQVGIAEILITDTNEQIVMKSTTWWNRQHLRQALNGHIDENMQQDSARKLEKLRKATAIHCMHKNTNGMYTNNGKVPVLEKHKLRVKDLVIIKNVKTMVKTADKGGWMVTDKNNKGAVMNGSRSIIVKSSLKGKLRRGDRIILKSKGNPARLHFVGRFGTFDDHTVPLDHPWRHNDNDTVRIYRLPVQAPLYATRLTISRGINNTGIYQFYLRQVIRSQAFACRSLHKFGMMFDDDMLLARGSLGLMTLIEKRKEQNKRFTHKLMTARDEKIRLGVTHAAHRLAKYSKQHIKNRKAKLMKQKAAKQAIGDSTTDS